MLVADLVGKISAALGREIQVFATAERKARELGKALILAIQTRAGIWHLRTSIHDTGPV
jgi:hypothetical protein